MYTVRDNLGNASALVVAESGHIMSGYRERARARRKRRRKVMKRKFRNFRKKWRKWWRENWAKFLKVLNKIGALFLKLIPIVGPVVSAVAEVAVSAAISAGEVVYKRIQAGKAVGSAGYDAFKAYMDTGAPDGVIGSIHRIQTKYDLPESYPASNLVEASGMPVVDEQIRRFEALLKRPDVVRIMELEEQADQLPDDSPEQDALEDQIEALEDGVLPEFLAIEQALDEEYWRIYPPIHKADPRGGKSYAQPAAWGNKVKVWFTDLGDTWVKWIGNIEDAPEGTTEGVWYAVTGTSSMAAMHAMSTDSRDSVMEKAARERDKELGCCWEYKWNPYAKKRLWVKTDPGTESRAWARLSVLQALGKPIPDSLWDQLGGTKAPGKPLPPPEPWKACPSGANRAKSGITQMQATFNSHAREKGLPTILVDGKYNAATEDLLKRIFASRGLPTNITQGVVKQNFERMGYGALQAKNWEDAIAYFKRTWREKSEGLRGPELQAASKTEWHGEGAWPGYVCEIYYPGHFAAAKERYDRFHKPTLKFQLAPHVRGQMLKVQPIAPLAMKPTPPPPVPVYPMIGPMVQPEVEKKKIPGWGWALIGFGGVLVLGGAAYGISQAVAKERG